MFELKTGEIVFYPRFSVCKVDDMVIITTKKIASRFFEVATLSVNEIVGYNSKVDRIKAIDYFLSSDPINSFYLNDIEIRHERFGSDTLKIPLNEFYEELKVKNISDVFSVEYTQANKVVFITRNPTDRFYTGFIEWVDSEFGKVSNGLQLRGDVPQEQVDSVLNEYVRKIDYNIFSDAHMSLWNTFLINFLVTNNIEKYVKIVNLDNPSHMQIFKKDYVFEQPSNKSYLNMWLTNSDNRESIEELYNKFKFYFDLETESYNKLLNINYKQLER
jgi:hypothetical protein